MLPKAKSPEIKFSGPRTGLCSAGFASVHHAGPGGIIYAFIPCVHPCTGTLLDSFWGNLKYENHLSVVDGFQDKQRSQSVSSHAEVAGGLPSVVAVESHVCVQNSSFFFTTFIVVDTSARSIPRSLHLYCTNNIKCHVHGRPIQRALP